MFSKEVLLSPTATLEVTTSNNLSPPPGSIWIVLGGVINHITGTDSSFFVAKKGSVTENVHPVGFIIAGYASGPYPARGIADYTTGTETRQSYNPSVIIVTSDEKLHLDGGVGCNVKVRVIQLTRSPL